MLPCDILKHDLYSIALLTNKPKKFLDRDCYVAKLWLSSMTTGRLLSKRPKHIKTFSLLFHTIFISIHIFQLISLPIVHVS